MLIILGCFYVKDFGVMGGEYEGNEEKGVQFLDDVGQRIEIQFYKYWRYR